MPPGEAVVFGRRLSRSSVGITAFKAIGSGAVDGLCRGGREGGLVGWLR